MDYRKEFRIKPDAKVKLHKMEPSATPGCKSETEAVERVNANAKKLEHLHAKLYAEGNRSVLIVLQGLDAAGKDGTIKHAFTVLNPEGTTVASFKQPTPLELKHDFLWRVHPHVPGKGEIVIFNRSHYEDVLVTRVHKLIDKDTWTKRYDDIRAFESLLLESGTAILKFFLHISPEEQLRRFAERLDDPTHNWKISEFGLFRAEIVGSVHRGFRGRPGGDQHQGGAVVRHSFQPQMVPNARGLRNTHRYAGGYGSQISGPERGPQGHPQEVPPGGDRGKKQEKQRLTWS